MDIQKNEALNSFTDKLDKRNTTFSYHFEFNTNDMQWELILKHDKSDYAIVLKQSERVENGQRYFVYDKFSEGAIHTETNHVRNKDISKMVFGVFEKLDIHFQLTS